METNCEFKEFVFNTGERFYQCIVRQQDVPRDEKFEFVGQHLPEKSDSDVNFVEFRDSNCPKVPHGLTKTFPNLKVLGFFNSKLKEISKDDLAEYKNLEKFICEKNEVEFLPGDLFDGFENLKYIKFLFNNLKTIEPNLLDKINMLEYVNFIGNPNYATKYRNIPGMFCSTTLDDVKNHLFERFFTLNPEVVTNFIKKFPDPNEMLKVYGQKAHNFHIKLNILESKYNFFDEMRLKEIEMQKNIEEKLNEKVRELEESKAQLSKEMGKFKESEMKLKQQVDQMRAQLENEKEEKVKLKRNMQKQIDNLEVQLQSIMSLNLNVE